MKNKKSDPPNSTLLTDFFIKNVPLMNESAFLLSVSVNHPPTSASLQFQTSQFVPSTLPNLRHHPRRARHLWLHVQLFKVPYFFFINRGQHNFCEGCDAIYSDNLCSLNSVLMMNCDSHRIG